MSADERREAKPAGALRRLRDWVFHRVLGMVIGPALGLYGLAALLRGRAWLPGQVGGGLVQGRPGLMLGLSYLSCGTFLFLRLFLERRTEDGKTSRRLLQAENVMLIVLIATLVYVLLNVGEVK